MRAHPILCSSMRYHVSSFMTTHRPLRPPVLLTVAVGFLLLRLLSQVTPALAGGSHEGIYVVNQANATVARYLIGTGI